MQSDLGFAVIVLMISCMGILKIYGDNERYHVIKYVASGLFIVSFISLVGTAIWTMWG